MSYEQARAKDLDSPPLHRVRYQTAFLEKDEAGMREQVAWSTGKLGIEDELLAMEADTAAYHGRLRKARDLSARAEVTAKQNSAGETAATYRISAALRELEFGNTLQARQDVQRALAKSPGRDVQVVAALALALAGDSGPPRQMIEKLNREFPLDTLLQGYWLPSIRAALALKRGNTAEAIDALQTASPYELSDTTNGDLFPVYLRGLAYLGSNQGQAAATEFRNILAHPGLMEINPRAALAHVHLARALVMSGDVAEARKEYQDFLALWKDADPDIPILRQAKTEYAKLG